MIDNGRMLRNFVQIMRSGAVGPQVARLGAEGAGARWLERARASASCCEAAVGNDPSLADIVRMVHPKPAERSARRSMAG